MNENRVEEHKKAIANRVIECLDNLFDLDVENITIQTIHHNNPKYYEINISDSKQNKIGINIHKLK